MITAMQSQKIKAANQLVEARETLWAASNNMYFNGDETSNLRLMTEEIEKILTRLVTNKKSEN